MRSFGLGSRCTFLGGSNSATVPFFRPECVGGLLRPFLLMVNLSRVADQEPKP